MNARRRFAFLRSFSQLRAVRTGRSNAWLGCALFVGLAAMQVGLAPTASADTAIPASPAEARAQAKKYFDEGAFDYTQGNYEGAVAAWQKSYDLSKEPLIFENIGNAYERLGKPREARDALTKWREVAPPEEHAILDRRIANLTTRIARDDAEAQKKKAAEDALRAQAAAANPQGAGGAGDQGFPVSLPGLIIGSVGLAAVIAGVVVDGVAASKRPDKSTVCKKSGTSELCLDSAKDSISTSNTMAIAGDATWIVGAAAVATGGVLMLTYKRPSPMQPQPVVPPKTGLVDVIPFAGPMGGGVVARGRW